MGLMGTVTGLIGLSVPIIGGYLYEHSPDQLLLWGSILEAMSITIILLFFRDKKPEEPEITVIR